MEAQKQDEPQPEIVITKLGRSEGSSGGTQERSEDAEVATEASSLLEIKSAGGVSNTEYQSEEEDLVELENKEYMKDEADVPKH